MSDTIIGLSLIPRSAGLSFFLSLGRVHRQYPFARQTAAKGRQYLAHNIMHRQSHQSPQCRTLTITRAPASQDGTVQGGRRAEKETERERIRERETNNYKS